MSGVSPASAGHLSCSSLQNTAKESLNMNIEKRNFKMFNTITVVVLVAVLLTAVGGIILQRQAMPAAMGNGMPIGRSGSLLQPESSQTSPTGRLVLSTGIILLIVGFGILLALLLVRRNLLHRNPS